jgi:hypothetical protein
MADIKILMVVLTWICLAAFIISNASANYNIDVSTPSINPQSVYSSEIDLSNNSQNASSIGLNVLRGNWTVTPLGLKCNGVNLLNGYATCEFGSKKLINLKYGENFRFDNLTYRDVIYGDNVTDEFSINVMNTAFGAVEIKVKGGKVYVAYTTDNINGVAPFTWFVTWHLMDTDWSINDLVDNSTWIGYELNLSDGHWYKPANNGEPVQIMGKLDVYIWHDGQERHKAYTCYAPYAIIEKYLNLYHEDAYTQLNKELNFRKQSRLDTNMIGLTVTNYDKYQNVSINSATSAQYNLMEPKGMMDNFFSALIFQTDTRVVPIEYQLFLLGIPYLIIGAWIFVEIIKIW